MQGEKPLPELRVQARQVPPPPHPPHPPTPPKKASAALPSQETFVEGTAGFARCCCAFQFDFAQQPLHRAVVPFKHASCLSRLFLPF